MPNAHAAIRLYANDVRKNGARRITYGELAALLGLHRNQARSLGPLLDAVRVVCLANNLPDISSIVVRSGTDLPSPKSFDEGTGLWRKTGLDRACVRAEQDRVIVFDWFAQLPNGLEPDAT